jgi:hypothetical protein
MAPFFRMKRIRGFNPVFSYPVVKKIIRNFYKINQGIHLIPGNGINYFPIILTFTDYKFADETGLQVG